MKLRSLVLAEVLLLAAGLLVAHASANGGQAPEAPATVFVYNGVTNNFDSNAQGYIWQALGLLDANGKPGTVQGNNVVDGQGKTLGTVIRDGQDRIIGYRSADGKKEAYDVSAGATTVQAWNSVAVTGTLHIIKHGAFYTDDLGTRHNGGGIRLDGDRLYDGFADSAEGTGTGVGYTHGGEPSGPYVLPPRPGASIKVNVNSCWSSKDPDDDGPETSVTGSAAGVQGVGSTEGHSTQVQGQVSVGLSGGTAAQQNQGWQALQAAASAAGFRDGNGNAGPNQVADWLSSLPFGSQHSTAQGVVDKAVPPPGTVTPQLSYSKAVQGTGGATAAQATGLGGYSVMPLLVRPGSRPTRYAYGGDWPDADPWPSAWITVMPGLVWPTVFHLDQLGEPPAPLPANHALNSALMAVTAPGLSTFPVPVEITLQYFDNLAPAVWHSASPASGWVPLPVGVWDPAARQVTAPALMPGAYAVLAQVAPGLAIAPPAQQGSGSPGSEVVYTLTVSNTGDYTDTIALSAAATWTTTLSTSLLPGLGPGLGQVVILTVTVPLLGAHGVQDLAVVTATSSISPALSTTAQVTTTRAPVSMLYLPVVLRQ